MFNAADLANFRSAQDDHMMDEGVIGTYTDAEDSFGAKNPTWSYSSTAIKCGLDMRPGSERHTQNMSVVTYDATLRLPIATTIGVKDRFKVTKRYGETLGTPLVYDIAAPIQRGPSGIRLVLKKVEA